MTRRRASVSRLTTTAMGAWLSHRRWPVVVAVVGFALASPSLGTGWILDDHHLRLQLQRPPAFERIGGSPLLSLFSFADGVPEHNHRLMDIGFWPWWTLPTIKGSFLRPITAVTHWLDHALWRNSALLMHLQSLMWFAGLIYVTAILYRRILGRTFIAGLAALLYAMDDAHCLPAAWLANRNALIAAFFGVLTIIVHDRWRRDGWTIGAALGPLFLALSLLSKEEGVATCGYLLAHAVFLDRGSWRRRITALWAYVVVTAGWRFAWSALGYGVSPGFFIYVDPLHEPLRYLGTLVERAPIYLAGQFLFPPADTQNVCAWFNAGWLLLWTAAAAVVILAAGMMIRRLRPAPETRFFAAGMMLSLLSICTAAPSDRLLLFTGLGAFAIVAQYLSIAHASVKTTTTGEIGPSARHWSRRFACLLLVVHVILAPLVLFVRSFMPLGPPSLIERSYVKLPDDLDLSGKTVAVLNAPFPIVASYLPERRALNGLSIPAHTRVLGPSIAEQVSVSRPNAHTLVLDVRGGLTQSPFSQLARTRRYPMHVGQKVELTGMTAEVQAVTDDGLPAIVAFTFAVPLDDPSLVWVHCTNEEFERFTPPRIGETISLGRQAEGTHQAEPSGGVLSSPSR